MDRVILIAVLLGGLLGFHYWDRGVAVHEAEKAVTARLNKEWKDQLDASNAKAAKAASVLNESHYLEVKSKDDKINNINAKLSAALISLSHRPVRPPDNTPSSEAPSSCTGRELYREDGEFLAREASRAEAVVVERNYYYNEYESLRKTLETLRK